MRHLLLLCFLVFALVSSPNARADETELDGDETERTLPGIVAWWTRPEFAQRIGVDESTRIRLAKQLEQWELSYQLAQTGLREARQKQSILLESADATSAAVREWHAQNVAAPSADMLKVNFDARLWVREQFSPEQRRTVIEQVPGFFRVRWFRRALIPVRQGQVISEES